MKTASFVLWALSYLHMFLYFCCPRQSASRKSVFNPLSFCSPVLFLWQALLGNSACAASPVSESLLTDLKSLPLFPFRIQGGVSPLGLLWLESQSCDWVHYCNWDCCLKHWLRPLWPDLFGLRVFASGNYSLNWTWALFSSPFLWRWLLLSWKKARGWSNECIKINSSYMLPAVSWEMQRVTYKKRKSISCGRQF